MADFYGTLNGSDGQVTRRGSIDSGILTQAAAPAGAIEVYVYRNAATGKDCYQIREIPWQGCGRRRNIAKGIIGEDTHKLTPKGLLDPYASDDDIILTPAEAAQIRRKREIDELTAFIRDDDAGDLPPSAPVASEEERVRLEHLKRGGT